MYKKKLKICKDSLVRPETIKLLEENIDSKIFAISLSKIFLNMFLWTLVTKATINKQDYIKLKKLLYREGNHRQQQKKATHWVREGIYK